MNIVDTHGRDVNGLGKTDTKSPCGPFDLPTGPDTHLVIGDNVRWILVHEFVSGWGGMKPIVVLHPLCQRRYLRENASPVTKMSEVAKGFVLPAARLGSSHTSEERIQPG
jgi:hypothetical protein